MKILFFGYGKETTSAVSNILYKFSKEITQSTDVEVYLFGYSKETINIKKDERINVFNIYDEFSPKKITIYRFIRKINHLFGIDNPCLSWKYLANKANKIFRNIDFDYVIGVSGYFMYMQAAYHFAKDRNIKYGMFYFDSFINRPTKINKSRRKRIEKNWLNYANFALVNTECGDHFDYSSKMIGFKIPIFSENSPRKNNGKLVYGGIFYKDIRPQSILDDFIKTLPNYQMVDVYSPNYIYLESFKNVVSYPMLTQEEYDKVCLASKALIIIGNSDNTNILPSKILSSIAFKKPIIGLNFKEVPQMLKDYPFYFDGANNDSLKKIDSIKDEELNNFDIYKTYSDRNPKLLVTLFLNLIKK